MTICYFGDYDPEYNRTLVLLAGLKNIGTSVIHCNVHKKGWRKYWGLWRMHYQMRGTYDVLIVGFGDSRLMPIFAKCIATAPTVWDPLYSLYDNWIFDRKLASPISLKAFWYWILDWWGSQASDLVFLDTETNAQYFSRTFRIPARKFARVLVGADTETFFPQERTSQSRPFEVEFHGKYIPVQGTDVIVRAAKLLEGEGVHFTLIGKGQEFSATKKLAEDLQLSNITFLPFLPRPEIAAYIRDADACLGILGDIPRVVRAIPNKLYEAAAMARVSISADTSSLREVFTPEVDAVGVPPGDSAALARAIRELKEKGNAQTMGRAAYETFMHRSSPERIAQSLLHALSERGVVT